MSDTPRTEIEYARHPVLDTQTGGAAIRIDFARQLELELQCLCRELGEEHSVLAMVRLQELKRELAAERKARTNDDALIRQYAQRLMELAVFEKHLNDYKQEVANLKSYRSEQSAEIAKLNDRVREFECGWGKLRKSYNKLRAAIAEHHSQKADDRCIEDDDRLYAAAGLPPCDRRVGDKAAMLANCARFIERRCEGGGWPSYRELEAERDRLREIVKKCEVAINAAYLAIHP